MVSPLWKSLENVSLSPDDYLEVMLGRAAEDPDPDDPVQMERAQFTNLNIQRTRRILKHWQPGETLAGLLGALPAQTWAAFTEPWCGDSAQCLPCIQVMASLAPQIRVRMILRDDHLDLMDGYLTDGKRGIPKLVALDASGEEIFRWGPRPAEAQAIVGAALAEGLEKADRLERLHLFYGRNRGAAIDAEFVALLQDLAAQ